MLIKIIPFFISSILQKEAKILLEVSVELLSAFPSEYFIGLIFRIFTPPMTIQPYISSYKVLVSTPFVAFCVNEKPTISRPTNSTLTSLFTDNTKGLPQLKETVHDLNGL